VSLEIDSMLSFTHTQAHGQCHLVPLYAITVPVVSFAEKKAMAGESETT